MRVVILTNIPTPYRLPVYDLISAESGIDLHVLYMAARERNRHWRLPRPQAPSTVLPSREIRLGGRYVHIAWGVWRHLRRLRPDVLVTTGFNPPQLLAVLYCTVHGAAHVAQTDGTPESEERLTSLHRIVRRIVAHRTAAFVAASDAGLELLRRWGAPAARVYKSPLAVDNAAFAARANDEKDVDLLFSGQLSPVKNPLFALEVAARCAAVLRRPVVVAFVGDGPLRDAIADRVRALPDVEVRIAGFQQQQDLPAWYGRSRVFLFPTTWDPWGLVLNEASAAGIPSIVSPFAGSGQELITDGIDGYVRPLDPDAWALAAADLLTSPEVARPMAEKARLVVSGYTFQRAAAGLVEALEVAGRPR